ncbi:MAG: redoxin domain-containing protein [Bacteroidia bacterium]|nr:redoxin domain-containing protein [Bacteroidia bacterium]
MKIFWLYILILLPFIGLPQDYTIKIILKNGAGSRILLSDYYGEKSRVIDSTIAGTDGAAVFNMSGNRMPGLYKIILKDNGFFDLIYNNENIVVSTSANAPMDSLKVLQSDENSLYYSFLIFDINCRNKLELLSPLINYYPEKDKFYRETEKEYILQQKLRNDFINDISRNHPGAYCTKIIRLQISPFIDPSLTDDEKINFLRAHYFDNIDLTDTCLLRTNTYTNLIITYFSLYRNPQFTREQIQAEFIKAVDVILDKASKNGLVFDFILEYLIGGFEKFDFEKVVEHLAVNYQPTQSCQDDDKKSTLQKRIDSYKKFVVGKQAPDFYFKDINEIAYNLYSLKHDTLVLVFWATWCPHCRELMPVLKKIYDNQKQKRWEVIAISLDTDEKAWKKFIQAGRYSWINYSELKGWNSTIADLYNIYATPTVLVLDRNKKIIAKPVTSGELKGIF